MAKVIYQPTAGRLRIGGKDYSLEDLVMTYFLSNQGDYLITIKSGVHPTNVKNTGLSEIEDDVGGTYANIAAWIAWWDALEFGMEVEVVDAAGINTSAIYRTFSKTVTRPANQTVYAAGDVIGDVAGTLDAIVDVAKVAGYGVCITNIRIQTSDTGLSGKTIRVHILNDSDTAIADNAAFVIGDSAKRRGYIDVVMGTGNLAKEGQTQAENLIVNPIERAIYFILETTEGFTPSADSTALKVEIGCILSN